MRKFADYKLYIDTVKYLRPVQIAYRVKYRLMKKKPQFFKNVPEHNKSVKLLLPELDMNLTFLDRFNERELLNNKITLVGEKEEIQRGVWFYESHTPLWNYNLHYFEYGVALAARYRNGGQRQYKEKILEWINDWCLCVKDGVGWDSYPVSLRICNWLIIYELLEEKPSQIVCDSLYSQYKHLIKNQEKHLLGNHYFENLKTIVICSIYFKEEGSFRRYWRAFIHELKEELLDDGVHFERSVMYHKIVMEDIIRVVRTLESAGNEKEKNILLIWLKKMATALSSLEKGMGKMPHFNDAADGVSKETEALLKVLQEEWRILPEEKKSFPCAGYYKMYDDSAALMFDIGELGPRYMTGHGHCDALSFELSIKGVPILVNAGTYQYQGKMRSYFRSTRANNTVVIDKSEQSEIWGEHRTGRRIYGIKAFKSDNKLQGRYISYKGYLHQRTLTHSDSGKWIIEDIIKGPENADVSAFFHAAPGLAWRCKEEDRYLLYERTTKKEVLILQIHKAEAYIHTKDEISYYASGFGMLEESEVLEIKYKIEGREIKRKTVLFVI